MRSKASKPISACDLTDLWVRPVSTSDLDEVLRLSAPAVWAGLRNQSLFITGGTGFVGKWLLECLLHADREMSLGLALTVLTREPDRFTRASPHLAEAPAVELVKGDVVDFEFPRGKFSSVVHAALPVAPPQSGGGELQRLAQAGVRHVCDFASASGARRLLHISSGAVYSAQQGSSPLAEELPWTVMDEGNDYTRAKRLAEAVVAQVWPFDVVIARCFAFIGPYLLASSGSAAAQFIEQAACGRGITVQGTGEAVRTYQYAGDMARWLLGCLVLGASGRAYNVGGDEGVTIAQLAGEVTRLANTGVSVHVAGRPAPGLAGPRYVPDLRRASGELGLTNVVALEEGIRRTLSWRATPDAHPSVPT
jgi:nucleoside-diphosphate-sugar epimerase